MNINPIAIDLGAAHTGVYSAHYPAGSDARNIERSGTVYNLEKNAYTLLMVGRTATRHQRRGMDRRQMAKRLFRLIWEKHLCLPWNADVSQSIGFLLNRRGFSVLTEEYDKSVLSCFPAEVWSKLPSDFKNMVDAEEGGRIDLDRVLQELAGNQEKCGEALEALCKEVKKAKEGKDDLQYYGRTKLLKEYCQLVLDNASGVDLNKKGKTLQQLSRWIIDRWIESGVQGLEGVPNDAKSMNMTEYAAENQDRIQRIRDTVPDYTAKTKSRKDSMWDFDESSCDMDKLNLSDPDEKEYDKSHIHHLTYALYKVHGELVSGGRHRKKYFDEVLEVLSRKDHTHGYLKRFCSSLQGGKYSGTSPEKLTNLIGHISNLELKPLRKYFDNKAHRGGDFWDEARLTNCFDKWLLREWRVNPDTDREKQPGKPQDYKALKERWTKHSGGIVDFWMTEAPISTIPPYQDNNNRRPPRCQSLILHSGFLDQKYPRWKEWLSLLEEAAVEYLGNFRDRLEKLQSSKGKPYYTGEFSGELRTDSQKRNMADLDARVLHFILDRSKASDPLKLNEIYSRTKKIRQEKSAKDVRKELAEAIEESRLPDLLKTKPDFNRDDIFPNGEFLHFVCRYYKMRQRARDGRIFIHPEYKHNGKRGYERTTRFDNTGKLLIYCNHKPRQKRYQMFHDLAGVLQVNPDFLKDKIGSSSDDELLEWIKDFKMKDHCKKCAEAQKDHKGYLGVRIAMGKDKKLTALRDNSIKFSKKIGEKLFGKSEETEARVKKFESVFSFAQIYNIVFTGRTGNSNTCPVCSMDNSYRMESIEQQDDMGAKAQRLPAIPTRLIDGGVMRMTRILTKQIAEDQWPRIQKSLAQGTRVRVPIITESNRFEFEPSLRTIKGDKAKKKSSKKDAGKAPTIEDKEKRIQAAGGGICPYTGSLAGNDGELDHIIPRSSRYGTLNDEANLIYASKKGNNDKLERFYTLSNLHTHYKQKIFDTADDGVIEKKIVETIWDADRGQFKFGRYKNFVNLEEEQQKAFRHALFLGNEHPLKKAVLQAIDNRSRALVNGTQRYFAEILANAFYKKALSLGRQELIDFDYFGVEAVSNSKGDGIKDLRKLYEFMDDEIEKYAKAPEQKQESYSHLLDAQMAFLLTADRHKREGSLQLVFSEDRGLFPVNRKTGEVSRENLFTDTLVRADSADFSVIALSRRKPREEFTRHRAYTRDTMYGDHYLPVLMKKEKDGKISVKAGFDWTNSGQWKSPKIDFLNRLLPLLKQRVHYPETPPPFKSLGELYDWLVNIPKIKTGGCITLTIDKLKLHKYWMEKHNTKTGVPFDGFAKFCYSGLGYRTEKRKLTLQEEKKEKKKNLFATIANKKNFQTKFPSNGTAITIPQRQSWINLKKEWEKHRDDKDFGTFLRSYFRVNSKKHPHQKVRKVFSLPILTSEGKYMLRRQTWEGKTIFQIVNDSDSRSVDNKIGIPVFTADGKLGTQMSSWGISGSFVKLSDDKFQAGEAIDPEKWYELDAAKKPLPEGIARIFFLIPNNTRPMIKLELAKDNTEFDLIKLFREDPLCKRRFDGDKKKNEDAWQKETKEYLAGQTLPPYKGAGGSQLKELFHNRIMPDETSGDQ